MNNHRPTVHSFSDFNRGMQTRRYIKPTICSRDFLTMMSMDLRPEKEWGHHLAKATGTDVSTITQLNLEFCNIQSTYGIGYLRSCKILKLNNNIISKIIGFDELKALKILDLSFNSVDRIEGLEKCEQLQELLLFHNTISKIEGVSTLKQLILLNLGCNQIKNIQEIHALRHLSALRSLSLERNPVCKVPHYREQVIVWISQVRCLDWKRILSPMRAAASEMFREKYRSFVGKERSEEKRRKAQEAAATTLKQDTLIPVEFGDDLYKYLNPSPDKLAFIFGHVQDGPASHEAYRQKLLDSGSEMNKRFCDLLSITNQAVTGFDARIKSLIDNYAACGKVLVEGFILRKYKHLESIKEEADTQEKEKLRVYCQLIDDVSHDLVKLLMQLQLKIENMVKRDSERLASRIELDSTWLAKEAKILQEFEEFLLTWTEKGYSKHRWSSVISDGELHKLQEDLKRQDLLQDDTWLTGLKNTKPKSIMEKDATEKAAKLTNLETTFHDRLTSETHHLQDTTETHQEKLFHCRLQEIVDFVAQHKAEAFLTRKRALARNGKQEKDDDDLAMEIKPEVQQLMNRKTKTPATPASGSSNRSERVRKVEFESDEPLADYVVMKDIKDVVDQISHIPLAERQKLFETRVVDVDDIADFVHVKDEQDEAVFADDLKKFEPPAKTSEDVKK